MRSSLVVAALFGLSSAMPAKLAARDPNPVWVTTTIYIDDWSAWPTPDANQKNADPDCDTPVAPAPAATSQPAPPPPADTPAVQAAAVSSAPAADPSPAPAAAPAASSGSVTSGSYSDMVVSNHNVHRSNHSAPAMVWDQGLADTALAIAKSCKYAHNVNVNGGGYGQNIAAGAPVTSIDTVISNQFYNNEVGLFVDYGQATPADFDANFEKYGHFTQLVWIGSTSVGCASVDCSASGLANVGSNVPPIFHVCNYSPAGNFLGEFGTNVLPSLGQAPVSP